MHKLSLRDLDLKGKKVVMRVDFNVPLNKDGSIEDDMRIKEALPSIEYILSHGGAVILMSHLGRPKGKKDPQFSLRVCADRLKILLKRDVFFAPDCIGPETEKMAAALKGGDVLLLENLRFYSAEENPDTDPSFAKRLARLGDVYVNDAFGTAHRRHASTATIAAFFPQKAAAGFLIEKELSFLEPLITHPKHPFYAIIGGAKISSKLGVLNALLDKVDGIFIGGGMAFPFLKAQGLSIGDSLCENELLEKAQEFLVISQKKHVPIYLPIDLVIANQFNNQAKIKIIASADGIPSGWQGMDIGPATVAKWTELLKKSGTVLWNGPLGVFEFSHFAKGTHEIAKTLATSKSITIVGGGDSAAAVNALKLGASFSHVSTGGGATLEFLEYGHLPGIDALSNKS